MRVLFCYSVPVFAASASARGFALAGAVCAALASVPSGFASGADAGAREAPTVTFGRPALSGEGCDSFNAFSRVSNNAVRIEFDRFLASGGASVRCGAVVPLQVRGGVVRIEVRRTIAWSGFSGGQRPARIQSVGDFGGRALDAWTLQPFLGGFERDSKRDVVEVRACAPNGYRGSARLDTRIAAPVSPGASIDVESLRLSVRVLSVSRCD